MAPSDRRMILRVTLLSIAAHAALVIGLTTAAGWDAIVFRGIGPWDQRPISQAMPLGEASSAGDAAATAALPSMLRAPLADQIQPALTDEATGLPTPKEGDASSGSESLPDDRTPPPTLGLGPGPLLPPPIETARPQSSGESSPSSSGVPAMPSDRAMDGFAREESLDLINGAAVAREGRRVKLPRPQWSLATYSDVWTGLSLPASLRFAVRLDADGAVRDAWILRGTGYASVDQPVLLAVFAGTFAPSLDLAGNGIADTIGFTVTLR